MSASGGDRWLDHPANIEKLWRGICIVCGILLLLDLFYSKHAWFSFEEIIGFYAFFGFVAFCFVVLAGKRLRSVLMRGEDYYDE